jgi:hypothetical protein
MRWAQAFVLVFPVRVHRAGYERLAQQMPCHFLEVAIYSR